MTIRELTWRAGAPLRWVSIGSIRLYRMTLSGLLGGQCRFYPTCSHYAEDAIRARGFLRGWGLATWRILRCNPFGKGGLEPAPAPRDSVIHPVERPKERIA
jgi:putative membrane protein insertion efficiency factor